MGRKFLLMVLAAASLMFVSAGLASGATQTFMDLKPIGGIPIEAPTAGFPLAVDQFDPDLGVLQEVKVEFEITLGGNGVPVGTMSWLSTSVNVTDVELTLTLAGRLTSACTDAVPLATAVAVVVGLAPNFPPGDFVEFPISEVGVGASVSPPLPPYIGKGTVDFNACFAPSFDAGANALNGGVSISGGSTAKVTVTYEYLIPSIDIEKSTNGVDADVPSRPMIKVGDPVQWDYLVTNDGEVTLDPVAVTDDVLGAIACPETTLEPEEFMTCTLVGVAEFGHHMNSGKATGTPPGTTPPVMASDPSHYFGYLPMIDIEKATNGQDADTPTGPSIAEGGVVNWTYKVINTGNLLLTDIAVVDDQGVPVSCPLTMLPANGMMTCTAQGVAVLGQYANLGSVEGQPLDLTGAVFGDLVVDSDPSHYIGTDRACVPKKSKPKPKKYPKGTKYVKVNKKIYVVHRFKKKLYVKIGAHRYTVKAKRGKQIVAFKGKKFSVKKLAHKRFLAQGNTCPVPPKPDPKDKPNGKPKGDSGKTGYEKQKTAPKPIADVAGTFVEPPAGTAPATCVGSKGYWKKGPGRHGDEWTLVGAEGKKTKFFASGRTYVKVLRRASGRPYFALAQAYIVAALNTLHGAPTTPEIEKAMAWVERYYAKRKPRFTSMKHAHGAQAKIKKIKRLRNKMVRHAGTLNDHGGMPYCSV